MKKRLARIRCKQKGFTLVEILAVVAILGIIAAVAIPNIISFFGEGDEEAALAEQHNLQVAVSAWMHENMGSDPTSSIPAGSDGGIFDPYLRNPLQYAWEVSSFGAVSPGAGNPIS
jgi:type IV pilus assembly protein PilA